LVTACAGGYSSTDRLTDRVRAFNNAVRWGRYFSAAEYVKEEAREQWLADRRNWSRDMRVADYEVVDSVVQDAGKSAVVRVVISWYRLSRSELQTTMITQRWRLEGRTWQLVTEDVEEGTPL
jgi:hypothetical protein